MFIRRIVATGALALAAVTGCATASASVAPRETVTSCADHLITAISYARPLGPVWRHDCQDLTRAQRRTAWARADRATS